MEHTGSSATSPLPAPHLPPSSLCQFRDASATPGPVPRTASDAKELQRVPSVPPPALGWESSLTPRPAPPGPKSHEVVPKIAGY